jgi:hypothetical protein
MYLNVKDKTITQSGEKFSVTYIESMNDLYE